MIFPDGSLAICSISVLQKHDGYYTAKALKTVLGLPVWSLPSPLLLKEDVFICLVQCIMSINSIHSESQINANLQDTLGMGLNQSLQIYCNLVSIQVCNIFTIKIPCKHSSICIVCWGASPSPAM